MGTQSAVLVQNVSMSDIEATLSRLLAGIIVLFFLMYQNPDVFFRTRSILIALCQLLSGATELGFPSAFGV